MRHTDFIPVLDRFWSDFSQVKIRNTSRSLNRSLNATCNRHDSRMLDGRPRPRPPNYLAIACRHLAQALRISKRMAKNDPHLFGPHARAYFHETLDLEKSYREIDAALDKVYGPQPEGKPALSSTLWTDRYVIEPARRGLFHKWFKERYGS